MLILVRHIRGWQTHLYFINELTAWWAVVAYIRVPKNTIAYIVMALAVLEGWSDRIIAPKISEMRNIIFIKMVDPSRSGRLKWGLLLKVPGYEPFRIWYGIRGIV